MNQAHLHLMLAHIPVLFVPLGFVILLLSVWRKRPEWQGIAAGLFQCAAVVAVAVFLLGEGAEEAVEHAAGAIRSAIEPHEDAATASLIGVLVLGVVSVIERVGRRLNHAMARSLVIPLLLISFLGSASLAYTANQGGRIRHPEGYSASVPDRSASRDGDDD